ncbi:MAG: ABC transporter ATP-binding protein [Cyclobacteriaceae bacterium]|nr:ABC transporter ATP-binding protein [Cyclobacteriaceae bacterium]
MSDTIINIENLHKIYRLGNFGTGTLKDDLTRWWLVKVKGQEDPFIDLSSQNIREQSKDIKYVKALEDINLSVKEGEVLGIVGRNGAGKSTLLKILSRVTLPTKGSVSGYGRIASLLEVGTGFHQDLTGRENIFLNGHILGMRKKEIREKFDQIVDFSGVHQYIDTPVKRYSSGMYVRLAFAVAAHLDPEILVVDEVLAVGDSEFQKKCLGKMRDVSKNQGRTILFVSHNMQAVKNLCQRVALLERGRLTKIGQTDAIIGAYLNSEQSNRLSESWPNIQEAPGNDAIKIKSLTLHPSYVEGQDHIDIRTPLVFNFQFWNQKQNLKMCIGVHLFSLAGECIFDVSSPLQTFDTGLVEGSMEIPGNFLNDGSYYLSLIFVEEGTKELYYHEESIFFEVEDHRTIGWYGKWMGYVRPSFPINFQVKEAKLSL